jgi:hypothetical protein
VECTALQALRDFDTASESGEALGERRFPPLSPFPFRDLKLAQCREGWYNLGLQGRRCGLFGSVDNESIP